MSFKGYVRRIIDPGNVIFTHTNRILMHNFFRFGSFREFREWQSDIYRKDAARMIDFRKLAPDSIPVILNNFNRLYTLEIMVTWLNTLTDKVSILIIDNFSTYAPLLAYYQRLEKEPNIQVIKLGFNSGRKGIFRISSRLKKRFKYYVVSDADLIPYRSTPTDLLSKMKLCLEKCAGFNHVGVSLEIEDIPDHSPLKQEVIRWESQYWAPVAQALNNELFVAAVDTTFAMYRSTSRVLELAPALRMNRPYTFMHCDWYLDPQNLTDEFRYYLDTCKRGESTWMEYIRKNALLQGDLLEADLQV